jgi:hypothetical protein
MIQANITTANPIRIFWASAAAPFQNVIEYDGSRNPDQLEQVLRDLRSVPGGQVGALVKNQSGDYFQAVGEQRLPLPERKVLAAIGLD